VIGQRLRHSLMLADDGIIDLIAVELTADGTRPVALTRNLARAPDPDVLRMAARHALNRPDREWLARQARRYMIGARGRQ